MAESVRKARVAEPSGRRTSGYGLHYRMYRARDGWAFVACRPDDLDKVAKLLGARDVGEQGISDAIGRLTCAEAASEVKSIKTVSIVRVTRLDDLRESCTIDRPEQFRSDEHLVAVLRRLHPSGRLASLPLPTWHRFGAQVNEALAPAPAPGTHTLSVLSEIGLGAKEVDRLMTTGVARNGWSVLKRYFPL